MTDTDLSLNIAREVAERERRTARLWRNVLAFAWIVFLVTVAIWGLR